jgi:uncharacterized protein
MSGEDLAWVALVVLLASSVQNALGFGASVIVVSLGALRVPIATLLPALVPISCLSTATIVLMDRAHVDARLLLRRILPLMAPGVVLGALLAERLVDDVARRAYGVMIVALAAHALWRLRREAAAATGTGTGWIALAGLVHGVFATGGPLLVYAVDRLGLSPRTFRATLAAVWLTLNIILTVSFALRGRLSVESATSSLMLVPALLAGLAIGHRVHTRLDPRTLRTLVLGLLLIAGASLVR